ncbi:hypothetical protein [Baaleninema simplex]|uniref:hypothetical protein n=1 Tax=Baaleninema simplex TaxID=2862350 RepID=UPI00034AFF89|nr:hypothetical protein [Baaleninema simplex]
MKDLDPESNCEKLEREGSRNPNREVWESPSFQGGEDVNASSKVGFDVGRPQLSKSFSLHFLVGAVREAGSAFS